MAASFAAYASQFLTRQQSGGASSLSSSQPLFYSFTTDNGSHAGNGHETDLDDLDDPHLRGDSTQYSRYTIRESRDEEMAQVEDDDPYLRLDEDEPGTSRHHSTTLPLLGVSEGDASKGWLAHASPLRSPSPPLSESSVESHGPPPNIFSTASLQPPSHRPPPPPPPRAEPTLSLTESLLPRDGRTRPLDVFSLPDPRYVPRGRRKFNDSRWTAVWCAGISICYLSSILILILVRMPKYSVRLLPYTTLLRTVPMLTILIVLSALVSYAHIFLLRIFVKPVMIATSIFIPATLFISAVWAFVGSFMWDGDKEPTWGETVGLRLFSIIPLVLCIITARRLVHLPRDIHTASSLLTLTTRLLVANPFLLALSPTVLLATLIASIPFITLTFRLLLVGYSYRPIDDPSVLEWHVRAWANWAIVGTVGVWLWSWGVARGVLRTTCAGVIGAWYFAEATQPSLGSVVLSALIMASIRIMGLLVLALRALPAYLPPYMRFVSMGAAMAVGYLETVTNALSTYALVYTGLTGDPFLPSARRARALTGAVESSSLARYRRKFKTEPPLTMLTVAPLALSFPFALATYLFVAHTLGAPAQALWAALLAGGVTALVGLFSVGLVKDTADALYICYCIDKDVGERRRDEVFDAFEYENRGRRPPPPEQQQTIQPRQTYPQTPSTAKPNPTRPVSEPRRTQQLATNPPPRGPTPDPFESSPLDEDPYSSGSSPQLDASASVGLGMNMSMMMGNAMSAMSTGLGSMGRGVGGMGRTGRDREPGESVQMSPIVRSANLDSSAYPGSVGDLEGGEGVDSQMFPGSDLF